MRHLYALVFLAGFVSAYAQNAGTQEQFNTLSSKCAEYHRKTDGQMDGYRIKIHFGIDKTAAREVQQGFQKKFSDILSYEEYHQPNFVIVVGDYKTRVDAYKAFKKIQADFPNAFIVKSKIKPSL